jgi:hypothetical protein
MLKFHPLVVADRAAIADDAFALTFAVPASLREEFRFRAGQHVALRCTIGGGEERRRARRRSRSACACSRAVACPATWRNTPGQARRSRS